LNNKIINNQNGVKLEAGKNIIFEQNKIVNSLETDFLSLLEDAEEGEEFTVTSLHPSEDALVDIERPDSNYGNLNQDLLDGSTPDKNYFKYFNIKRNTDGTKGRVGYYKFDLQNNDAIEKATLSLTGKTGSNTEAVNLAVYGIVENDWSEDTLVWNNAPNLCQDKVELTGLNETAFHLGDILVNNASETVFKLDVSDFVKDLTGAVSFVVIDVLGQNGNVNIYSKEEANTTRWPTLIIETKE
jgi:hypothetical protein